MCERDSEREGVCVREDILTSEAHFIPSSSEPITVFIPDIASSTHGSILSTFTLDNRYIYKPPI